MDDYITNDKITLPEEVADFGELLRHLRQNHGYTVLQVSKMTGIPPTKISQVELSKCDLPPENVLRNWFNKLGCGKNTNKLILMSRQYRVKHWLILERKESANPDMLRLIEAYRSRSLSEYDRALLRLIARGPA